jgi:hypothetical protein
MVTTTLNPAAQTDILAVQLRRDRATQRAAGNPIHKKIFKRNWIRAGFTRKAQFVGDAVLVPPDLDPVAVESEVDFEDSDLLSDDLLSVDLVSALVLSPDLVSLGFFEADCSPLVLASFGFSLPEFLKSVSYHPEPLSTKAAADTFFRRLSSPHSGQKTSGSSDIFCNASRWWSHETQAYS